MEKIDRMINNVIEDLDWRIIIGFYHKLDLTWYGKDLSKKNSLQKRNPTIEELQNELRTVCKFVLSKGLKEYVYEHWTILWLDPSEFKEDEFNKNDNFGCQLEVIFSPTRALSFENSLEFCEEQEQVSQAEMEKVILEDLLQKSVGKEDYRSAAKYRDKIKDLNKESDKERGKEELGVPVQINKRKGK
jgi:hypothetical protein